MTSKSGLLATLHLGDFFGEVSLIDEAPRLASALALSDGLLLWIDTITFQDLINEFPEVLHAIISEVIEYMRQE